MRCSEAEWVLMKVTPDLLDNIHSKGTYAALILACGAGIKILGEGVEGIDKLLYTRGQSILFKPISQNLYDTFSRNNAILSGEYLVPTAEGYLLGGATKERNIDMRELMRPPDPEEASKLLLNKLLVLNENLLTDYTVSHCLAGVRVMTRNSHKGKIPFVGRHPHWNNTWVVSGFGARGLVYHAYIGKMLSEAIHKCDTSSLPTELFHCSDSN